MVHAKLVTQLKGTGATGSFKLTSAALAPTKVGFKVYSYGKPVKKALKKVTKKVTKKTKLLLKLTEPQLHQLRRPKNK